MNEERARRLALNEALLREVNEAVEGLAENWFRADEQVQFRCECVDTGCEAVVALTLDEYASVRAHSARFVVVAGHELPAVERVVGELGGGRVVEKIGVGRTVAEETDPR